MAQGERIMAPKRTRIITAFAALYLIWGSTYLFIRFAIDTIPPFLMAGSRYLTAGLLLYIIARAQGAKGPNATTWRSAAISGGFPLLRGKRRGHPYLKMTRPSLCPVPSA